MQIKLTKIRGLQWDLKPWPLCLVLQCYSSTKGYENPYIWNRPVHLKPRFIEVKHKMKMM